MDYLAHNSGAEVKGDGMLGCGTISINADVVKILGPRSPLH